MIPIEKRLKRWLEREMIRYAFKEGFRMHGLKIWRLRLFKKPI